MNREVCNIDPSRAPGFILLFVRVRGPPSSSLRSFAVSNENLRFAKIQCSDMFFFLSF
jgi:hypothetical protein